MGRRCVCTCLLVAMAVGLLYAGLQHHFVKLSLAIVAFEFSHSFTFKSYAIAGVVLLKMA